MTILERNLFRLLRSGVFGTEELIEPLSAWKWNRLYQLTLMHDVAAWAYQGLQRCSNQFFVQLPQELMDTWSTATTTSDDDEQNEMLLADRLTHPVLNHKLQNILDDEHSNAETRHLLLQLLGIARFFMNAGIPVKRITNLDERHQRRGNGAPRDGNPATEKFTRRRLVLLAGKEPLRTHVKLAGHAVARQALSQVFQVLSQRDLH